MKFRKKPVLVEAIRWTGDNWSDVFKFLCALDGHPVGADYARDGPISDIHIETLEGIMTAKVGDWIIRGIKNELYPCKQDIFEATYESVVEATVKEEKAANGT